MHSIIHSIVAIYVKSLATPLLSNIESFLYEWLSTITIPD